MSAEVSPRVRTLRDPATIRQRCHAILEAGLRDELTHFAVDEGRLDAIAELVVDVTRSAYPSLDIPYHSRWNHFRAGGVDRVLDFDRRTKGLSPEETGMARFDLVVTSVLLDAGAGPAWGYVEDGERFTRSEGLAVASYHVFCEGLLSRDGGLAADSEGLRGFTAEALAKGFQVTDDNPLVGLEGRAELMRRLGGAVGEPSLDRPGALFRTLVTNHAETKKVPARAVFDLVITTFESIWPDRLVLDGSNLGDVWKHPAAGGDEGTEGLVPFHKLSQWLTYSLLEPLEWAGYEVTDLDDLTGLAEYRNGGLFVDGGVLVPKHDAVLAEAHAPSSEVVVEWRACTVALLDRVAERVRDKLGLDAKSFPLAKVLEGGTWRAGRELARERRPDGTPPIRIASDGTVF